jgi:hypothetical protein
VDPKREKKFAFEAACWQSCMQLQVHPCANVAVLHEVDKQLLQPAYVRNSQSKFAADLPCSAVSGPAFDYEVSNSSETTSCLNVKLSLSRELVSLAQIELQEVFRQEDRAFVKILNEVRWGEVSPEAQAALLQCDGAEQAAASDGVEPTKLYPRKVHKRDRTGLASWDRNHLPQVFQMDADRTSTVHGAYLRYVRVSLLGLAAKVCLVNAYVQYAGGRAAGERDSAAASESAYHALHSAGQRAEGRIGRPAQ